MLERKAHPFASNYDETTMSPSIRWVQSLTSLSVITGIGGETNSAGERGDSS